MACCSSQPGGERTSLGSVCLGAGAVGGDGKGAGALGGSVLFGELGHTQLSPSQSPSSVSQCAPCISVSSLGTCFSSGLEHFCLSGVTLKTGFLFSR